LQGIPFPLGDRRRNQIIVDYGGPQLLWWAPPSTLLRGCLFGGPHEYLDHFRIHFWWKVDNDLSVQWLGSEPQLFHGEHLSFLVQFPQVMTPGKAGGLNVEPLKAVLRPGTA